MARIAPTPVHVVLCLLLAGVPASAAQGHDHGNAAGGVSSGTLAVPKDAPAREAPGSAGPVEHADPSTRMQAIGDRPDAIVGGEAIYERDYLHSIEPQAYNIRLEEYRLKMRALTNLIDQRLLKDEARAQGLTEQQLIDRDILADIAEPNEQEVERRLAEFMFNPAGGGKSKDEVRDDITRERVAVARETYFRALRERAGVRIYLPRPRMQIGFDPARVRGASRAPVTIVEFSDFECPFCAQAYDTVKALLRKYDGKVSLAFRDLPLIEAGSSEVRSADAARCAQEQGKFWEYHDVLFETEGRSLADFRDYAGEVGLEMDRFNDCVASRRHADAIKADFTEGLSLGVRGTPYFFINGVPLSGAHPQADFEEIIEEELALRQ